MNYSLIFTSLSLLAGLLLVTLVIRTLKSSKGSEKYITLSLFTALSLYSFGYALELQSFPLSVTLRIIGIEYIGITLAPVFLLMFIFRYHGALPYTLKSFIPFLFFIPCITLGIVWSSFIIPWLYQEAWMNTTSIIPGFEMVPGIWWYVITVWNATLLVICLIILGFKFFSREAVYRKQTLLMIIGVIAPFSSLFINNFIRSIIPIDSTPFTLVITGLAIFPAITRYNLLNIIPVAHATVFKTLGSGLIVLDNEGRIREINPAAEEIFQVTKTNIIGEKVEFHLPHGDLLSKLLHHSDVQREEIEIVGSDRSEYYLVDVMPFHDGKIDRSGSVLMITRITDRKEKEEQLIEYTEIIETRNTEINAAYTDLEKSQKTLRYSEQSLKKAQTIAHLGIYECNPTNHQIYTSEEFIDIFGIRSYEHPPDVPDILLFVAPLYREQVSHSFDTLLRSGIPFTLEFWIERPDGTKRALWGQGEIEIVETGTYGTITFIVQDITDRKLMEEKIHEAYLEKEILLREIHHRVKNNMQIISSLLSMQSRTIDDSTIRNLFKETQARVRSLALVHEQLYQSGNLNKINYQTYLEKIINYFLQSYEVSHGVITCNIIAHDIELTIEKAVPCSLIISELLTNSFKHAFEIGQKGTIIIRFSHNLEKNQYILDYRDNGKGIQPGFNPETNSGIGTTLINGLTQQLSGIVQVEESNPGVHYIISFPDNVKKSGS